ncbi:unnamed protein product [Sympodiomycopsis kandeliae]
MRAEYTLIMSTWSSVESELSQLSAEKTNVNEEIANLKESLQFKIESILKEDLEEFKKIDQSLTASIPMFMDKLAEKREIREEETDTKEERKRRLAQKPDESSSF